MTRRGAIAAVFGLLVALFVASAIVTVVVVRDRLVASVDKDLRTALESSAEFLNVIDVDDVDLQVDYDANERAVIIYRGDVELAYVPAGHTAESFDRPDLDGATVAARGPGPYTVGSVGGELEYRVMTVRLDDGRYLSMASPLADVQLVLGQLSVFLVATSFAVLAVIGVVFWLILRASLRPYDNLISTASAIAGGDLSRRADSASSVPAIAELTGAVNTMLDQIQDSFIAKQSAEDRLRQFVADASHELRTPLTSISGYSELYLSGAAVDAESVDKQMTRINSEARRLGRLVDDLLTLARLDEHDEREHVEVDLTRIATDAATDFRTAFSGSPLDTDIPTGAVLVTGDHDALRQVVTNLLANAHHHTPAGTPVRLTLTGTAGGVRLTVADDGPGMSADVAAHVFDRFYREDKTRSRAAGNSGLGLSIVQGIVRAHGGTVGVESAPGAGTAFTVSLPPR